MAIKILCPSCGTHLSLTDDRAGSQFSCPRCDTKMLIPGVAPLPYAVPAAQQTPDFLPPQTNEDDDDSPRRRPSKRRSRRRDDDDDDVDDRRGRRGFECPYCGSRKSPIVKSQISSTGWIVFALLLVFTVCLCFIGLFITEETRTCRDCGMKLN